MGQCDDTICRRVESTFKPKTNQPTQSIVVGVIPVGDRSVADNVRGFGTEVGGVEEEVRLDGGQHFGRGTRHAVAVISDAVTAGVPPVPREPSRQKPHVAFGSRHALHRQCVYNVFALQCAYCFVEKQKPNPRDNRTKQEVDLSAFLGV